MMPRTAFADAPVCRVPLDRRVHLLKQVAGLSALPPAALGALAQQCSEEMHTAGSVLVREGEAGERLYVIAAGVAEASVKSLRGSGAIAALGEGEDFGGDALGPTAAHQTTVTAVGPLLCLTLAGSVFKALLEQYPATAAAFHAAAEEMVRIKFLKQATPFSGASAGRLSQLAERLDALTVLSGETIVREGEPGDACYLLRAGRVEVVASAGERTGTRLATLNAPAFFGEAALLTKSPRNATVRALADCQLLRLHRSDLLEVMGAEHQVARQILDLLPIRARPRRIPGATVMERSGDEGETITILKNPERFTYFRLSTQGRFLWDRLDGRHTLRDLTLDYLSEFKTFAPQAISDILGALAAAGFIETHPLPGDILDKTVRLSVWKRALRRAIQVLEWRTTVRHVDGAVTRVYERGVRYIYTRVGQALLAVLALAGLIAFLGTSRISQPVSTGMQLLFVVPAFLLSLLVHEAGHAFTTKAVGCEVLGVGVGWYWFGPVVFVDTSDVWRATRNQRMAVSIAGPYTNAIGGGIASLAAWLLPDPGMAAALRQVALLSYVMALLCLNPLLEYDGYYVLMDWLGRANLRSHAFAWLGRELPKALRAGHGLGGHRLELLYGAGSLLYVAAMCGCTAEAYRALLQPAAARLLPAGVAAALGWTPGVAIAVLSAASVLGFAADAGKVR